MQDVPATHYVIRVFNGPLHGCEFKLSQERTLFIVGPEAVYCSAQGSLPVPEDAFYIPLEQGGCNFEVLLPANSRDACTIRLLDEAEVKELTVPFQTRQDIGGLLIALRVDDEAWESALLTPVGAEEAEVGMQTRPAPRLQKWLLGGVAALALTGMAISAWYFARPTPVSTVEALISGAPEPMMVLRGRDARVYVFASTERDAAWGRQVLVRSGYTATQVMTFAQERERLEALLINAEPQLAFHRLDLSSPTSLRLSVSRQRNLLTPQLQTRLQDQLTRAAPYALQVEVDASDDAALETLADQGLQRLGVPFTRQPQADSVRFSIEGSLGDSELQALRSYVADFQQQWGDRYIHFAIELKDDWLKGKSFQYGPQGYIKMTPSSWYFPKPL
ncbi:Protein PrgH [Pseudomonas fluorescens]|uniref:PrgH/EprH family type III secretion apparatus protein n=1 Tax=Pseudomonas fluorescens TaxID=294 RepID=UPI00125601C3|nr:PrgH/EprH family type III secretion apparatus protein [Pseudomonas fluorescens]VVP32671.1 Protein PrgH [Pseudomonas fluorescens]